MATRQPSSSGKLKSPRIQVVLPEPLWQALSLAAKADSRTVSNMAKVLIHEGLQRRQQENDARARTAANRAARLQQATDLETLEQARWAQRRQVVKQQSEDQAYLNAFAGNSDTTTDQVSSPPGSSMEWTGTGLPPPSPRSQ